ncbi:MAG: hypothetical protein AAB425_02415, partial [Bdellovibrionota bacterium]
MSPLLNLVGNLDEDKNVVSLRSRPDGDRMELNATAAAVAFGGVLAIQIRKELKENGRVDIERVLGKSVVAAGAAFAAAAPFSQGSTNLIITKEVLDVYFRWIALQIFTGKDSSEKAGNVTSNLAIALSVALGKSVLPAEVAQYLPCKGMESRVSDFCNSFYYVATKALNQGVQEAGSAMLDHALRENDRSPNRKGMGAWTKAGSRGAIAGASEALLTMAVLGAPKNVS